MLPETIRTVRDLQQCVGAWRAHGLIVGMVPTMGSLHAGHMALVEAAKRECDRVVVTLFVNPTQFAPAEDLTAYPRDEESDRRKLQALAPDILFAPSTTEMYPAGFDITVMVGGPSAGLESDFRPHFFAGVATIVAKLLIAGLPDRAFFGEKDFQQLLVVKKLVRDLGLPTKIIGCPTMREPDGLAMSSRNVYLSADERARAPRLHTTLQEVAQHIRAGEEADAALAAGRTALSKAGFMLDYLELRNADTLAPVTHTAMEPLRLLVAARLGQTRLIDNIAV